MTKSFFGSLFLAVEPFACADGNEDDFAVAESEVAVEALSATPNSFFPFTFFSGGLAKDGIGIFFGTGYAGMVVVSIVLSPLGGAAVGGCIGAVSIFRFLPFCTA